MCCQMAHNWDGVGSTFNYYCRIGNAIEGVWTRSTVNKCAYQAWDPLVPHWTYNESVPVPGCIRKQFFNYSLTETRHSRNPLGCIPKQLNSFVNYVLLFYSLLSFVLKCVKSLFVYIFGLLNIKNLLKNLFFIIFFNILNENFSQ